MLAFRFVALCYAMLVFLIAPSWLAAEEEPAGTVPPVETQVPVGDAVPTVPELPRTTPAPADAKKKQKPEQEPVATTAASASITITDFEFTPATVTVNEGDTVTWTNDGPTVHTATAEDGSFDTGSLRKGESGSATFTSAGTISYICSPHPFMKGKVVVQAASSGTGGSGGSGGGDDTGSTDDTTSSVAGDATTSDTSSGLPDTGRDLLSIVLLGLATLGFGVLLRRRAGT